MNITWSDIITGVILPVLFVTAVVVVLIVQMVIRLAKYARSGDIRTRRETRSMARSIGETLKSHRIRCGMTPEFVAESVGVSRKAVLRWEKGVSVLNTTNLLPLADLYGVAVEELQGAQG